MTLTPISDDGDNGSMHNAVLKDKYKKIKLKPLQILGYGTQYTTY